MKILVTGSSSGLGKAIYEKLQADSQSHDVIPFDKREGSDTVHPLFSYGEPPAALDVLINCAGINRPDWIENTSIEDWQDVMDVNVQGILQMTKWALSELKRTRGTIVNIVSNASHVPMRCSIAYNASKAAAHMMTLQMARELGSRHSITVFGISPNKLADTGMSNKVGERIRELRGWTVEEATAYQLAALPAGEETPPAAVAEFLAFLLSTKERHKYLTGTVIPYGG